jgi:hypothetical protein
MPKTLAFLIAVVILMLHPTRPATAADTYANVWATAGTQERLILCNFTMTSTAADLTYDSKDAALTTAEAEAAWARIESLRAQGFVFGFLAFKHNGGKVDEAAERRALDIVLAVHDRGGDDAAGREEDHALAQRCQQQIYPELKRHNPWLAEIEDGARAREARARADFLGRALPRRSTQEPAEGLKR